MARAAQLLPLLLPAAACRAAAAANRGMHTGRLEMAQNDGCNTAAAAAAAAAAAGGRTWPGRLEMAAYRRPVANWSSISWSSLRPCISWGVEVGVCGLVGG